MNRGETGDRYASRCRTGSSYIRGIRFDLGFEGDPLVGHDTARAERRHPPPWSWTAAGRKTPPIAWGLDHALTLWGSSGCDRARHLIGL